MTSLPNILQQTRTIKRDQEKGYAYHRDTKLYVNPYAIDTQMSPHTAARAQRTVEKTIQ
jgi:hypothetical protein